jgi:3-oxoacyl-[acyl-carrier protein] reductase
MATFACHDDRVALVTGASRGIGRAVALALGECGAKIAVNFRSRTHEAEAVVAAIEARGGKAVAVAADVSVAAAVETMLATVAAQLGPVDLLINNAGVAIHRNIDDLSEADFDQTIATNLKSAFLCTRAVIPGMRERRFGRIVNISSGAARGAGVVGVHYNASKAGLEGLTRGYAARLARYGITVNAVAPSLIDTEMMQGAANEAVQRIPVGRKGTPEEVAQAVIMVTANPYMTGQTVQLNGGLHFN